jgi:DNA-binding cell septation regulator SpoVG
LKRETKVNEMNASVPAVSSSVNSQLESNPPSISVEIYPAARTSQVASARVRLVTSLGVIVISDCRLLRNRSNVVWMALPSHSTPNGRSWDYHPTIELSPELMQEVTSAVLRAYATHETKQTQLTQGASNAQPSYSPNF